MPSSPTEPTLRRVYRRRAGYATEGEADECVLVPAADAAGPPRRLKLNRVGAWVWERLDGRRNGDALVEALMAEFDVDRGRAERDLAALVERLLELEAVEAV